MMFKSWPVFLCCLAAPGTVGVFSACPSPDDSGDSDSTTVANPWEPLLEDLPGVLLSVWGTSSNDVWTVGAATGGAGPEVHHWDGSAWTQLDAGVENDLWWVFGAGADVVWLSGSEGTVVRHDRAANTFVELTTPTEATLYGTWGPSDDLVFSVGGYVEGHADGAGVILVIEDSVVTMVDDLPVGIDPEEMFFKVWGTSASDVWVIGDMGSVLHFDGADWTRTALPDNPRLVTLSGSGPDDIVVVGGVTAGLVYQRSGAAWEDVSPTGSAPLNGVFVTPGGQAAAAGLFGTALERVGSAWVSLPLAETLWDWHGIWIDEAGTVYTAGGDFFNLEQGTLYKYVEEDR